MTDKHKPSKIDNVACAQHLLDCMEHIEFKHVRRMNFKMTDKPKTFTTEIEWFNPRDKVPSKPCMLLIALECQPYGTIIQWFPCAVSSEQGFHDGMMHGIALEDIKYWAYLPDLSEDKNA